MGKSGTAILVPLIIGCAQFMQQFDGNVIATALPSMAVSLGETPVRLNIAITSYLLALAVFVPISGWMSDRFGARPIFTAAICLFTLASAFCGAAHTLPELIAARLLQGIGGSMMTPVGRVIIAKSVPKAALVTAMMWVSLPGVLGPVLGPPVGGFIVTFASWRWIFLINIPFGMLGAAMALRHIPNFREERTASFDILGFMLTGVGIAAIMIGFETMGRSVIPASAVVGLLLVGLACAALYVRHARRHAAPLLDLSLLKVPPFRIAVIGGAFFYIGSGATPFLLALLYQVGFGLSALVSGLMSVAMAAGSLMVRLGINRILRAAGFRRLLIGVAMLNGLMLVAAGFFRESTPYIVMVLALIPLGFARSVHFSTLSALGYSELPVGSMGAATSFQSMFSQLFQSFGVGFGALLVQLSENVRHVPRLGVPDVSRAFYIVGALAFLGAFMFSRLAPDAGTEMSGRAPAAPRGSA